MTEHAPRHLSYKQAKREPRYGRRAGPGNRTSWSGLVAIHVAAPFRSRWARSVFDSQGVLCVGLRCVVPGNQQADADLSLADRDDEVLGFGP